MTIAPPVCAAAQHRFIVRDVFDHVKRTGKIEHARGRNVAASICTNSTPAGRRRGYGSPGEMQFGANYPLSRSRLGDSTKDGAIAATDFKKPPRIRKNFLMRPTISSLRKCSASTFESGSKDCGSIPTIVSASSSEHRNLFTLRGADTISQGSAASCLFASSSPAAFYGRPAFFEQLAPSLKSWYQRAVVKTRSEREG
jgi:hypothetical protein